ncbi:hypothetical protein Tco_0512086 [Tanacetum coccineum]
MHIKDYMYQEKLHEPLKEAKPTGMKIEDGTLLDRQALGVVRLSLSNNVDYNIVKEKTTYDLIKTLSNMYKKPSASNKVFLIRQLVNTQVKKGASVEDHVNGFNSILSRLVLVEIKFDDEVHDLLLLFLLPESWLGTVIALSGSIGTTKLMFDNIRNLIHGEDIHMNTSEEYSNSLLVLTTKAGAESKTNGRTSKDKDVNIATGDSDDALHYKGSSYALTLKDVRLGHMSEKGMKIQALKGRILDLQRAGVGFCSTASSTLYRPSTLAKPPNFTPEPP